MKIGIIGYGYVGRGMAHLFYGHDLAVYDPASHPDKSVLLDCGLVLICVPTPMSDDSDCDLRCVFDAAETAIAHAPEALVCIKSAVSPGTTDLLNEMHETDRFHVSPEYMGEGRNFVPAWEYPDPRNSRSHDFVIVGGPRASEVLDYFQSVMATTARYMACRAIEAELVKRFENAFFATKVTFCNEMARIAQAMNVDYKALRELWLLDSRIGRSHTAVFPNDPGFGGKCLPKDLAALINEASSAGYQPSLLCAVQAANDAHRGAA
jgi:UDPglucose 6-dehydrogenase